MRKDTAEKFKLYFSQSLGMPNSPVFPNMPKGRVGAKMIKIDLQEADIPYEDSTGKVIDFHALRHTFITRLAQSGIHPSLAMSLARHSDINLTMARYTHTVIKTRAEAIECLPELGFANNSQQAIATGTDPNFLLDVCLDKQMQNHTSKGNKSRQSTKINEDHENPATIAGTASRAHLDEGKDGTPSRTRTWDPLIKSQLLCQLS